MKVTIVGGGGTVGSTVAYRLAQDGFVSEIVLFDIRENMAEAHALDIEQSIVNRSKTKVRKGNLDDTYQSDIVIIACALWGRPLAFSRTENLRYNLNLVLSLMIPLKKRSPDALWIVVTTPVDTLVHIIHRIFSIPRNRIAGINGNDTARFKWAISKVCSVPAQEVKAFVLGEHGDTQVPIFSNIEIKNRPYALSDKEIEEIKGLIGNFLPRWVRLQPGRTAGWATSEVIGDMVKSIVTFDKKIWVCSTPLSGEYGLTDVSLGVPIIFNSDGIEEIVELTLNDSERELLASSARAITEQLTQAEIFIKEGILNTEETLSYLKRHK
ncbi:MAG: hypothetical protein N2745_12160 [Syntrophorhabdaceae bacterium]|nr:hypothetical protein [Syntrophorhabdaceae bacterium]